MGGAKRNPSLQPLVAADGYRFAPPILRSITICLCRYSVHRADLVAVEIAQIGEIEFARAAFANAGRIFAVLAAVGDARRMPGIGLFGRVGRKTDGAAIGVCRRLAVDRLRHREHASLGEIENTVTVDPGRPDAERAEQRVVERLGLFQVVGADHDMRKHSSIPPHFFRRTVAIAAAHSQGTTPHAARCRQCRRHHWRCTRRRWEAREPPPLPVDYGSVIRPERVASAGQRGASTHPGILKRRRGNSYLWDASPGVRCGWAKETTMSYLKTAILLAGLTGLFMGVG